MRDYLAKELQGDDILSVQRFREDTRWMIEFIEFQTGREIRLYLSDEAYRQALALQKQHKIKIRRYAHVVEGHIIDFRPRKHRRHR